MPARAGRHRVLLWIAASLVLLLALSRLLPVAIEQLGIPFDLGYESPSLRSALLIAQGRDVYARALWAEPPYMLSQYTPLYYELVACLPARADNPYFTGRLVAGLALLLAGATILAVGGAARASRPRAALPWTLLLLGVFLLVRHVVFLSAFLKSDTLGLCFSALGVLAAGRARRSGLHLVLCALCCVAAVASKQTYLAAGLACFVFLLADRRRRGLQFAAWVMAFGALLVALHWSDGLLFSLFGANMIDMVWRHALALWGVMLVQPVYVVLLLGTACVLAAAWARGRRAALLARPYPAWVLLSLLVLVGTLPKAGASSHYFLELSLACLFCLASWGAERLADAESRGAGVPRSLLFLAGMFLLAAIVERSVAPRRSYAAFADREIIEMVAARDVVRVHRIRRLYAGEPALLNLYRSDVPLDLTSRLAVSDPLLYLLLWRGGGLSTDDVVMRLRAHEFDGVLVSGTFLTDELPARLRPVQDAVRETTTLGVDLGDLQCLVPRTP